MIPTTSSSRVTRIEPTFCSTIFLIASNTVAEASILRTSLCLPRRISETRAKGVTLTCEASADDQVHELPRDDDRPADLEAVEMRLDTRRRLRARDELVLRDVGLDLEPVSHLTVHLDDELERIALELRRMGFRPRLLPQPLVPQALPQLLGDVRRIRLDQRQRRLDGEARRRVVRLARDRVHELHHGGDRRVQREPATDVVRDLRDRLVRLPRERRPPRHLARTVDDV